MGRERALTRLFGRIVDSAGVKDSFTSMTTSMDLLYPVAERRGGYFTTAQAAEVEVSRQQLYYLTSAGSVDRVAQGIYRLRRFPAQRFEDVIVACLWVGEDAAASHDTALAIYELADVMPAVIHITTPRGFRGRRPGVRVHTAPLGDRERTERAGVPVTTVERTIIDTLERSGPDLATQSAEQALERGLVTRRRLRTALEAHGEVTQPLSDLTAASP
ncbi:MAG: type IV toxin-antitoxin system AbiEi family antitoxin domain-containing protein [Nitriliruptoraceae bacterium]